MCRKIIILSFLLIVASTMLYATSLFLRPWWGDFLRRWCHAIVLLNLRNEIERHAARGKVSPVMPTLKPNPIVLARICGVSPGKAGA